MYDSNNIIPVQSKLAYMYPMYSIQFLLRPFEWKTETKSEN